MPRLQVSIPGAPASLIVEWSFECNYERGNGLKKSLTQYEDKVSIPSVQRAGNQPWKIFEDSRWTTDIGFSGFFGGNATVTANINGQETKLYFRIGGRSPDNAKARQYIDSNGNATEWFSYAIAKHETAEWRVNGSFYNQFRNNPTQSKFGLPTWHDDGHGPGGYGIFQITGTPSDEDGNIPRRQIWNWQDNSNAYYAIMRHNIKAGLAQRFYADIKDDSAHHLAAFNECPPPDLSIGAHTVSSDTAIWITAYNGWGGKVKSRYLFDPDLPCGVTQTPAGQTKRWYWNPPLKPNAPNPPRPYLNLVEIQMDN